MKTLLCILLMALSLNATADNIVISIGSKHINSNEELNEVNPGIGRIVDLSRATYKYAPDYVTYGLYYNSRKDVSVYASAGYMLSKSLSFEVGPVTGYDPSILISAIGVIHFEHARVVIVPPVPSLDIPLVIGLQIKI